MNPSDFPRSFTLTNPQTGLAPVRQTTPCHDALNMRDREQERGDQAGAYLPDAVEMGTGVSLDRFDLTDTA
jgi:hypothetical protein